MEAREAALRFIYFFEQYRPENPTGTYNGDIETTLDSYIDELNRRNPQELSVFVSYYSKCIEELSSFIW
jgi:hypothetical protein